MSARSTSRVAVVALLMVGASAWYGWQWVSLERWNAAIRRGVVHADAQAPAAVRFAAAYALAAQGDAQGALNAYRELDTLDDTAVRRNAKFNSATLYLAQAQGVMAGPDPAAALTWVELAKQSYRELLREDSDDWDARYNLERALRLAPDPEGAAEDLPPPPDNRHTPSTATGVTLGLP